MKIDYIWRNMDDIYIDQTLNIGSLRRFMTRHESILLFLSLTLVVTVLLVVFGQPTSLTGFTEQLTKLSPLGQIAICFTTGIATLILSRAVLFLVNRVHGVGPAACLIWLIAEMILCVSVMTLVLWALSGGGRVQLAPLVGNIVLGYFGVLLVPNVVTFLIYRLRETHDELMRIRQQLDQQDSQPVSNTDKTVNFFLKGGRLAFSTKVSSLQYIEAADNYVNIHYVNAGKEETFILLNSMKNIEQELAGTSLMRCHRRYMVNVANVKLMRKDGVGLVLELNGTSKVIPVSKSFSEPITQHFANSTNITLPNE